MQRLARIICAVLLVLLICLPLASWTASVLGLGVQNLLSGESMRWLFNHVAGLLGSDHLPLFILLITAIGAVHECGMLEHGAKKAHWVPALVVFVLTTSLLFLPTLIPHNALLSVTGTLMPSPWATGLPYAFCLNVVFTSVVFTLTNRREQSHQGFCSVISAGLRHHALWLLIFMMAHVIYQLIIHILI